MTTQPSDVPAALALLNAVAAYLQEQPHSNAKKRFLRSDGLPWLAKRMAYLEAENARLQCELAEKLANEQPVTFSTQGMMAAIEAEVRDAAQ